MDTERGEYADKMVKAEKERRAAERRIAEAKKRLAAADKKFHSYERTTR
jgi:hypothetical protein